LGIGELNDIIDSEQISDEEIIEFAQLNSWSDEDLESLLT